MLEKIKVFDSIQDLPDKFEVDDLIERLILIDKIQQGLDDVAAGRIFDEIETEKRFEKWLN
jgi:predicted transcriptional regulator